jgi:hypothetical protein
VGGVGYGCKLPGCCVLHVCEVSATKHSKNFAHRGLSTVCRYFVEFYVCVELEQILFTFSVA